MKHPQNPMHPANMSARQLMTAATVGTADQRQQVSLYMLLESEHTIMEGDISYTITREGRALGVGTFATVQS